MKLAVKTALAKRNMTMAELANDLGKDRASLTNRLYHGNPTIATVKEVAYALDFSLDEFFKMGKQDD